VNGPTPDPTVFATLAEIRQPTVSNDGCRLAYYNDQTGRNELYWHDRSTGTCHQATEGTAPPDGGQPVSWATETGLFVHDEGRVVTVSVDPDSMGERTVSIEHDGRVRLQSVGDQRLLYTAAPKGSIELYCRELVAAEGNRLQTPEGAVQAAVLGPDDRRVAATVSNGRGTKLVVGDTERETVEREITVGGPKTKTGLTAWFPDGRRLLAHDDADGCRQVTVVDTEMDDDTRLTDGRYPTHGVGVSPDGERVLAVETRRCRLHPVWIDTATGSYRRPDVDTGVVGAGSPLGSTVFDDGAVVARTCSDRRTSVAELPSPEKAESTPREIVSPPSTSIDTDAFVQAEVVTVPVSGEDRFHDQSGPSYDIECLLYEPAWRPSPSPAIVKIHGGPHAQARDSFNIFEQFLAALGYTVLVPNYRGSTGYGGSFRRAIHGDWGGLDQADVADAAEWLADRDGINGDRLAAYGVSYGGYGVYTQLVRRPSLWARGVACVGFTHLLSLFRNAPKSYRAMLYKQMGDPRENGEHWQRRSPLSHVDRVTSPVAAVQAVDDDRCPFEQAERFYKSLPSTVTADSELVEVEDGHGTTDSSRIKEVLEAVSDFLGPADSATTNW